MKRDKQTVYIRQGNECVKITRLHACTITPDKQHAGHVYIQNTTQLTYTRQLTANRTIDTFSSFKEYLQYTL